MFFHVSKMAFLCENTVEAVFILPCQANWPQNSKNKIRFNIYSTCNMYFFLFPESSHLTKIMHLPTLNYIRMRKEKCIIKDCGFKAFGVGQLW